MRHMHQHATTGIIHTAALLHGTQLIN